MWSMLAGLLLLPFSAADGLPFTDQVQDVEAEWDRLAQHLDEAQSTDVVTGRASVSGTVNINKASFPPYIRVPTNKYPTAAFKPGLGVGPLPSFAKELLIVPSYSSSAGSSGTSPVTTPARDVVEMLCHDDRIYVRIVRWVFKSRLAYKDLKMGRCPVNQGTIKHYYFLYTLSKDCGFTIEGQTDAVALNNRLKYIPSGMVVRETPFTIDLTCKYPRNFLSYKIGFHPKLQGGTIFKALTPKHIVTISAQDASGKELLAAKNYILGQPMYFEVKMANDSGSSGQRLYITKCFMTPDHSPLTGRKYVIIDNQGCMVESKFAANTKFLRGRSKMSLRFTLAAFVFNDGVSTTSSQQLYMHCEASVGRSAASSSLKACHYDSAAKKWKELYGDDSVCTCCDGICSAQARASRTTISSTSLRVDLKNENKEPEPWTTSANIEPTVEEVIVDEENDFTNYWEEEYD